jgi:hypothetical protein
MSARGNPHSGFPRHPRLVIPAEAGIQRRRVESELPLGATRILDSRAVRVSSFPRRRESSAGVWSLNVRKRQPGFWIPAYAGMTNT